MTIDRIHAGPVTPIDRSGADGRAPLLIGEASARGVARAVVGRIAAELSLAGKPSPLTADPFQLRAMADAVGAQLPGSPPAALGDLGRAIEALAGTIAADMAGAADGRTLDRLDHALADFTPADDGVEGVTEFLNEAARRIAVAP
jgi:hypothetical protein